MELFNIFRVNFLLDDLQISKLRFPHVFVL